ncbi:MAG: hypothetical protein A2289_20360 [Deltaproteobacteria bacterium RIFOXYA12_FULL_58_15]|nr:MAG: hypothetical protein A2289_20360 [Deltaproteobacteria bacterium RIFOXYA12_FULL_58_15]
MLSFVLTLCVIQGAVNASTVGEVFNDGRDAWSLHDQKLMNRQLRKQIDNEDQSFRVGRDLGIVTVAADGGIGAQAAMPNSALSRFHGFFLLDTYWALQVLQGLDVNLNLNILNPSASDGYRFSSQTNAGVGLHLHREVATIAGAPLTLDFVGIDLDVVTLGQGLLIERVPLEGHAASLDYRGVELRELFAGRSFWFDDDVQTLSLSALDGAIEMLAVIWLTDDLLPGMASSFQVESDPEVTVPRVAAYYLGASAELELDEHLRVAVEYSGRVRPPVLKNAVMARVDLLYRDLLPTWRRVALHVGYQFRFYQRGFGPRDTLVTPTGLPNLPTREDAYVTNSIEYFAVSKYFDQWSHTVMAEADVSVFANLELFGEAEYWLRALDDPKPGSKRVAYVDRFGRAPGQNDEFYYKIGLRWLPWGDLPHRMSVFAGNKFVASLYDATIPDSRRFDHDPLIGVEAEVFL